MNYVIHSVRQNVIHAVALLDPSDNSDHIQLQLGILEPHPALFHQTDWIWTLAGTRRFRCPRYPRRDHPLAQFLTTLLNDK